MISKSNIPVLSSRITSTCLFICSPFSSSLSFSLLFLHCQVIFSFFFLDSLNCKVASELILIWRVTFIRKILTEFWSRWCLLLCQLVEEELLILIPNTILIGCNSNHYNPKQLATFSSHSITHQCLSPSDKVRSCLWIFGMKLAKLG